MDRGPELSNSAWVMDRGPELSNSAWVMDRDEHTGKKRTGYTNRQKGIYTDERERKKRNKARERERNTAHSVKGIAMDYILRGTVPRVR
jgi:hypothetical protein